jgi:hypothetical protein
MNTVFVGLLHLRYFFGPVIRILVHQEEGSESESATSDVLDVRAVSFSDRDLSSYGVAM